MADTEVASAQKQRNRSLGIDIKQSPSLYLPDSVPDEFKDDTFLSAIKAAKQMLGSEETGLSAKSEFELYFQTGPSVVDYKTLQKRAQNVDIRYSKIRSVYWKVFLSLVNNDTSTWSDTLQSRRREYDELKDEYIRNAMKDEEDANLIIDNPLLSTSGGKWDAFYKDSELKDTIILDIDRTYPEDEFFIHKTTQNSLIDILFIYCKENEWISYKQGMNEIIAILYMVNMVQSTISPYVDDDTKIPNIPANVLEAAMDQKQKDNEEGNDPIQKPQEEEEEEDENESGNANDFASKLSVNDGDGLQSEIEMSPQPPTVKGVSLWETVQDIRYIEHDTYFMFTEIMAIMGQYFINAQGKEVPPVVERSKRIQGQFLRQMDTQLAQHLLKINLTPQLYGLRWIRLFFSREFHLRDTCVVWDAIFGSYCERKQQKSKEAPATDDEAISAMEPVKAISNALEKPRIKLDFRFVDYMSCSMLLFIRHQLIGRDLSQCLRRVMRYPPVEDVASLVERAYTIRDQIERRGKKANEGERPLRAKGVTKKWTSSELLSQFSPSSKPCYPHSRSQPHSPSKPHSQTSPRTVTNTQNVPFHPLPPPYNHRRNKSKSRSKSRSHRNLRRSAHHPSLSEDWMSHDVPNHPRSTLPNFSPTSVQRAKSKHIISQSQSLSISTDEHKSAFEYVSDPTTQVVGGATFAVSEIASSLWSSYGTKLVSNSIDSTRIATKGVKKRLSAVQKLKTEINDNIHETLVPVTSNINVSKLRDLPLSPRKVLQTVQRVQPIYDNESGTDHREQGHDEKVQDFRAFIPAPRGPFDRVHQSRSHHKTLKTEMAKLNVEEEESHDIDEIEDQKNENEVNEPNQDINNMNNVNDGKEAGKVQSESVSIEYNVNISSFSIDEGSGPPSPALSASDDIHSHSMPTTPPREKPSVSPNASPSRGSYSVHSVIISPPPHSPMNTSSSFRSSRSLHTLLDLDTNYEQMFVSMKQTFEHYYYYNNKIMTPQQHLMSRLRELEQIRNNLLLCITKAFEYNLEEYDVNDFIKNIPKFDFDLFCEFNADLHSSDALNSARFYYLNYLQTFMVQTDNALSIYFGYYDNHNTNDRGKSNNLNIADRWNQFSRTVSSAMTTYAEDVKNLMGGQRRTLKSRMQFEHALGSKMGEILNTVQNALHRHQKQLETKEKSNGDDEATENIGDSTGDAVIEPDAEDKSEETTVAENGNASNIKQNEEVVDDPLSGDMNIDANEVDESKESEEKEQKEEKDPLLVIEEALAELKLVKDALLGNLDETQLESWLDWTFVEPPPTEPSHEKSLSASSRQRPPPPMHKRLSSSGLPPPKKVASYTKPAPPIPKHPLDI